MKAFILSAGLGTRLLPYTLEVSKPCMLFLNTPLLAFNLQHLINIGVKEFIFNIHYLPDKTKHTIDKLLHKKNILYHFSHEKKLLNSAGGLNKLKSFFEKENEFLMLNADSLCLGNSSFLKESIDFHKKKQALATLLCCPSPSKEFKTVEVNLKKEVINIGQYSINNLHYAGYIILSNKIFSLLNNKPSHIFYDILLPYIKNNNEQKIVSSYNDLWTFFETGNIKEFKMAEKTCKQILSSNKNCDAKKYLNQVLDQF